MNKAEELITQYADMKRKMDALEDTKDTLRNAFAKLLHEMKQNELIVNDDYGKSWKVAYQTTTRKSVNYDMLSVLLSKEDFDNVVSENISTGLIIKSAPKKKDKSITQKAPVDIVENKNNNIPGVPMGEIK
jgi:predicted phage-related endonuclease